MSNVYFAENGLTSTSANFIANKSKEIAIGFVSETTKMSFIDRVYTVAGKEPIPVKSGKDKEWLNATVDNLKKVGSLYALNAWLREAIKLKDKLIEEANKMSLEEWCNRNNKPFPKAPTPIDSIDENTIIDEMEPNDRQKYLALEAKASAIGNFIHSGNAFNKARKELHELAGTNRVDGIGDSLTIQTYTASIDIAVVDETFMSLQEEYRRYQSELNGLKHKIQMNMTMARQEQSRKFSEELNEYNAAIKTLNVEFEDWKRSEVQKISDWKIVIPDQLKETYEFVKNS